MTFRNRCFLVVWLLLCAQMMLAQGQNKYTLYIQQYKDLAIQQMQKYHIPASITLAQGLLESGAGQSDLARKGNNHFGIKCHGWTGRTTYHDDDQKHECFRAYNSVYESYEDHSLFLVRNTRYAKLFTLKQTDYKGWAHGLKAAGYATNPQYASHLISVIEQYQLYQYDKATTYNKTNTIVNTTKIKTTKIQTTNITHDVGICNERYYVIAKGGDSFRSIALEFGLSERSIARYNERDKNEMLRAGDIIFLQKKRSKADRRFRNIAHEVKAGESLYLISQKYGITIRSLYKKNGLDPSYQIRVGDRLRVY